MSFTITEMPASTSNSPAGSMDGDANSTQGIPMARMTTGSSRGRSSQRMLSLESAFVAEPDELLSSRTNSPHLNTHVSIQTPNIEYKSTWRKAKAHIAHQHHALKGRRSDVRLRTAVAFMRRGADKNLANESTEGWMKTSKILQMHDETKIQGCKEDVDTLLVIAGLFSAVLTGFIVELFKTLQEDNDDQILAMLTQISHQLSGFQVLEGRINSTIPFTSNPPSTFQKSPLNVRVNILWFMSLTFSLITASLGMLVKQWLREYLSNNSLSPRTHVRTRHYRHIGVKKYRVFEIASFLPLLLQISLILFLIGLSDFLSALNTAVGRVVSALVFTWLALYCTTAIAPILSAQTPWKTPFLMRPLTIARNWLRLVGALTVLVFRHAWDKEDSSTSTSHPKEGLWLQEMTKTLSNLRERAKETCVRLRSVCSSFVVTLRRLDPTRSLPQPFLQHLRNLWYEFNVGDENLIRKDQRLDVASLVAADAIFRDDDFIDTLVQCSTDLPLAETIALARQIVRHRHDGVHSPALGVKPLTEDEDFIPQLRYWEGLRGSGPAISESALNKLRLCVLNAAQSHIEETQTVVENYTFLPPWRSNQMLEDLSRAIPFILSPTTLPFDSSKKVGTLFSKMFELDRKVACQALASFCTYLSINTRHGTTYENTRISTATGEYHQHYHDGRI
ncbi:hypothetical protein C8Q75DRAFT_577015 [Abortiporus biennis]|nr:hypothetical protein C8Q75DRAFT_577015 [Abortiporus biennis]